MARTHRLVTLLAVGGLALTAPAAPAAAHDHPGRPPQVTVLDRTVAAPFQLDHTRGRLLVADGGPSTVSELTRDGLRSLFTTPDGLGALGVNRRGDIAYGIQQGDAETGGATTRGDLVIKRRDGSTSTVDLLAYDRTRNPDGGTSYGIDHPTPCQEAAFEPLGGASYTGGVDSHPYAVAPLGDDAWVVADAGGNDLLKVDGRGRVSTLAVFPRQPVTLTAEVVAGLGLPDCVVGAVYHFEPVPTDVEVLGSGFLVSFLPGGPEDPGLGARGSVNFVDRRGRTHTVAQGFLGATNLAVDDRGTIYVAELFGGRISQVRHGRVSEYVALPNALSLEWAHGTLYAGTLATTDDEGSPTGPGSIVAIR